MLIRALTALVLLTLLPVIYLGPELVFVGLSIAVGLGGVHEAVVLFRAKGHAPLLGPAAIAVILLNLSFYAPGQVPLVAVLGFSCALVVGLTMILRSEVERACEDIATTLCIVCLPGFLLATQVGIRMASAGDANGPIRDGAALLLFLYAVVFGNDTAAYFCGRFLGRMKLAPAISPKKTVEGFVGGLLGGMGMGVLVAHLLPTGLSLPNAAGFGFLLAVLAVLGDLAISLLKRSADVKDTGKLLPGHGGILDRVDGLLFAGPLLLVLLTAGPR